MLLLAHTQLAGTTLRTTVKLDETLLNRAQLLSDVQDRSALLKEALSALIQRESARRLARLGGRAGIGKCRAPSRRQVVIRVDPSIWIDHLRNGNQALMLQRPLPDGGNSFT